ncbi:ABC transporter ATP-binding protein [Flavobacterium sp. NRK F10]|uniref:ABC transporter ATP-binding protein n=1 Tax=Flavobacterium sp. NRK F10 TaxID=2954931 RepID=UPI00209140F6|nr:ABC transporter ATP-binding protein [Flavobacterium sp. NRK F10]MCO6173964.1 ABC transporter ATP-binding protein [Flavobacterium sp. NRK F10]
MVPFILHTENLSIGYTKGKSSVVIQSDISLGLKKGKLIALIGKNGIGKSTFLKTITGILEPLSGTIVINHKDLSDYDNSELAQEMSLVLTESLPPSNLTVYEIVALGRQPYTNWLGTLTTEDRQKIDEAISLTGISDFAHKKHYEISDGQLQKTMIARALAQDTSIIILDEPTTHLDLVHKVTLLKLLSKLTHETGKTILYSTHDLDLAIQLTDEMIVFTENAIYKDEPCNLIAQNVFNQIFDDKNISFDTEKGKFIIK